MKSLDSSIGNQILKKPWNWFRLVLSAVILLTSPATWADCLADITMGMGTQACYEAELQIIPHQVAQAFADLLKRAKTLDSLAPLLLKDQQVRWRMFVDSNCKSEAHDSIGGSGEATAEKHCRLRMNLERLRLREWEQSLWQAPPVCNLFQQTSSGVASLTAVEANIEQRLGERGREFDESRQETLFIPENPKKIEFNAATLLPWQFHQSQRDFLNYVISLCRAKLLLDCHGRMITEAESGNWINRCRAHFISARISDLLTRIEFNYPPEIIPTIEEPTEPAQR